MTQDAPEDPAPGAYRFGPWRLTSDPPVLERDGERVSLPPQPTRALVLLVSRHGEVVTRAELEEWLWDDDTFVDREQGINFVIRRIRATLGDDAANARWVETIPRIGYRFVAPVEEESRRGVPLGAPQEGPRSRRGWSPGSLLPLLLLLLVFAAAVASFVGLVRRAGLPGSGSDSDGEPRKTLRLAVLPIEVSPLGAFAIRALVGGERGTEREEAELLSRVLTEELLTQMTLCCSERLGVMALDSTMAWGATAGIAQGIPALTGDSLPDLWLRGGLAPADEGWSLTLRLWRGEDGLQLWAGSFDGPVGRLPSTLEDSAARIARVLDVATPRVRAPETTAQPIGEEQYERFLRGRFLTVSGGEAFDRGLRLLEETAEEAPEFARGHAALAHAYLMLMGGEPLAEILPRAEAAARRALAVDPDLAEAHTLLGTALFYSGARPGAVEAELRRGVELGKGISKPHQLLGTWLSSVGRHDEAIGELRRAVDLDPLSPRKHGDLAEALMNARRFDEAVEQAERTLEIEPVDVRAGLLLVELRLLQEDEGGALAAARRLDESLGGPAPEDLAGWIDGMVEFLGSRPGGPGYVRQAGWRALAGHEAEALRLLDRACRGPRDAWWPFVDVDPRFDGLRSSPRFPEILDCLGETGEGPQAG